MMKNKGKNKQVGIKTRVVGSLFLSLLTTSYTGSVYAALPLNLPYGVTPISHGVYRLHMATFYICLIIAVLVFAVVIYSMIKYRRSKGAIAATFHENMAVEITWTVIPFIILAILAVPATQLLMAMHDTKEPYLDIKIIGYQWKWKYEYLDQGIQFFSNLATPMEQINGHAPRSKNYLLSVDHPMVVPIHKKVRLLLTSNDVIHSWWVPELGFKQDAIPGYINENWFIIEKPGVYRGQCAELCGVNHAYMPIVVKAVTQKAFDTWVAQHQKVIQLAKTEKPKDLTKDELMALGKITYNKSCAVCHQPNGQGIPPTFPALKGNATVTGPVKTQLHIILNGVSGTAMQPFKNQLDNKNIAAIATYLRNAWGNDQTTAGHKQPLIVQSSDVQKQRNEGE